MTAEEATAAAYKLVSYVMQRIDDPYVGVDIAGQPSVVELLTDQADKHKRDLLAKYGDACTALECWKPAPGEVHPCIEAGCAVDGDTEERWGHWVAYARGDALGGL